MTDEEAALLAELRAISNNSASAARFDDVNEVDENNNTDINPQPEPKAQPVKKSSPPKKKAVVKLKPKSAMKVNSPPKKQGGFKDQSAPKTFKGEFGGTAEDADLLAELRAISMKSNSANRFDTAGEEEEQSNNGNNNNNNSNMESSNAPKAPPKKKMPLNGKKEGSDEVLPPWKRKGRRKSLVQSDNNEANNVTDDKLPPWKRKNKTPKKENTNPLNNVEEKEASPEKGTDGPTEQSQPPIPSTFTFQGERGGVAEDADLLAELRAISMQSNSANRFGSNDDNNDNDVNAKVGQNENTQSSSPEVKPIQPKRNTSKSQNNDDASLPPWKRKNRKPKNGNNIATNQLDDVEVMSPSTSSKKEIVTEDAEIVESTLRPTSTQTPAPTPPVISNDGRSGKAEDADLLAELRAISLQSSSANRFDSNDDEEKNGFEVKNEIEENAIKKCPPKKSQEKVPSPKKRNDNNLPPWKRKKNVNGSNINSDPFDNAKIEVPEGNSNSIPTNFNTSNGFQGERGGAAHDADLLAELKAISNQSNRSDRFKSEDEADDDQNANEVKKPQSVHIKKSPTKGTPSLGDGAESRPWRKNKKSLEQKEESERMSEPTFNKSAPPSTFQGERGGAAEDADLLAALKAISNQASSADRFNTDDDVPMAGEEVFNQSAGKRKQEESKPLTVPSKRIENNNASQVKSGEAEKASTQTSSSNGPSGFPTNNSFQGERGGAAEDAALLAELRAISQQSSSGRFQESDDGGTQEKNQNASSPPIRTGAATQKKSALHVATSVVKETPKIAVTSLPLSPTVVDANNEEIVVTVETVRDALGSKNWKFRKAAYELFAQLVNSLADVDNPRNEVASDQVLQSLDELIPNMMKESNAGALDAALRFTLLYTDHCDGASQAEQAGNIAEALCTGPGLASARPSTSKLVKSLLLKTMEVGKDGVTSIHSVVASLMTHGLSSKKPKVVLNAVQLVLDAAYGFGAASLPLNHITSNSPKMLQHANRSVREIAIQLLAEICRAVGSKDPFENIINDMRASQVAELDNLLEKQSESKQPTIRLRHQTSASSPTEDALAVLQAGAEEAAAEAFASRPAVNIFNELKETEYASKMKGAKWSEKAGALDILLSCGGKKPYKLEQPSSSVNYTSLISELKRLLEHTHFAVKSKSMNALAMLAEGVGERLFANLRPLVLPILLLSKDKKLINTSEKCVDTLFGNVVGFDHLLEKEDGLPSLMKEKGQKNPIVRKSAISYLSRSLTRCEEAGPRGRLSVESATEIAKLCIQKTKDSDATVRTEAVGVLKLLLQNENESISNSTVHLTKELENSNPRLYKTLHRPNAPTSSGNTPKGISQAPSKENTKKRSTSTGRTAQNRSTSTSRGPRKASSIPTAQRSPTKHRSSSVGRKKVLPKSSASKQVSQASSSFVIPPDEAVIEVDEAWAYLASLNIENWSAPEDDGGVVLGLKSSNWKHRKEAINTLTHFARTDAVKSSADQYPESVVLLVKEHTKQFKDSNFNILKASMELFLAILDLYESRSAPLDIWMTRKATGICVEKIADKKFASIAPSLLTRLCELQLPEIVIAMAIETVTSIKSPSPHEGLLSWTTEFCDDFGAKALGKCFPLCTDWVLKECASTNVKVKKAAMTLIGDMHSQLGPTMKALVVANSSIEQSVKDQVEKKMDASPFKQDASSSTRQKVCLITSIGTSESESEGGPGFEIPKTDIVAALPSDCINRMGMKEGKDAWKKRKAALEEVEAVCNQYNGLISSSPDSFKSLVELIKALKSRLGDSQSNLKPLAVKNIAAILSSVDGPAQGKLGKIVYKSLIAAAMNENKKIMRDASIDALKNATMKSEIDGGGINKFAMEPFMNAFATELNESGVKAVGLPIVLEIILEKISFFPKVEHKGMKSKGRANGANFGQAILKCLTSSQSETRSLAEEILKESIKSKVLSIASLEKAAANLINAEQRKVRPILDSLNSISIVETAVEQSSPKKNTKRPASTIPFSTASRESASRPRSTIPFESRNGHSPTRSKISTRRTSRSNDRNSLDPRKRSMSRGRRESSAASIRQGSEHTGTIAELMNDPGFHPLKSESATSVPKEVRISKQRDHVPEYPEEPSGGDVFSDLKKIWAPLLPHQSVIVLFPSSGIKVQDDASSGCELLSHGIKMAVEHEDEEVVLNQIDLMIRWFSYALCNRETTTGMLSLISSLTALSNLLSDQKYQLTDYESFMLLPYLLEKAGAAKGRFREMIPSLITNMISDGIYPLEKYGSMICISVIENSSTPKTRGLAVRECHLCVEKVGLGAVGKKGVLAIAKSFSDETFTENKVLFLDLIELIIMKMNGDVKRFFKLCGGAYLSSKAKDSIDKRMAKRNNGENSNKRQARVSLSGRRSVAPPTTNISESQPVADSGNSKHRALHENVQYENDGPFKFSFSASGKSREIHNESSHNSFNSTESKSTNLSQEVTSKREANSGAAASLRERLRQIRDRHQPDRDFNMSPIPSSSQTTLSSSRNANSPSPPRPNTLLRAIMEDVDDLLSQSTPLGKNTEKSSLALIGLRRLHASLTNGTNDSTGTDPVILEQLREEMSSKVSFCVFKLASMLEFGFRCGSPTHPAGISIPLISVSIAGLMAIFIDPVLSRRVSESAVSITIRQATSSLLDHRLSATSASIDYGLDPSTCKKMVKAINKLAIQTTQGVRRDISFQSLMSLQLQFCVGAMEQNVSPSDLSNAHHRMSRIITKLFNRVLKAEGNEPNPFSSDEFDLEAVFTSLEMVLSKSQSPGAYSVSGILSDTSDLTDLDSMAGDKMAPCKTMCNTFMIEVLKAKHVQNRATDIKFAIRKIGYIRDTFTGRLFISCCNELGLDALVSPQKDPNNSTKDTTIQEYDADHLSELIFAVGNAEEDDDRVHALEDLRDFMDSHPGIDLESHLSSLSASFRKFIMEQMKSPFKRPLRQSSRSLLSGLSSVPARENSSSSRTTTATTASHTTTDSNKESMSMSEKLRYLKSKINAAEETAQSVIESGNGRDMPLPPSEKMTSPTTNFSSLRQRLAAASEKRTQTLSPEVPSSQHQPFESAALGNAAILRARLETVKRMSLSQT